MAKTLIKPKKLRLPNEDFGYFGNKWLKRSDNLLISFSGGETSAYMTWWILNHWHNYYKKIVPVFSNTGQEHEETLEFINQCDKHFNFNTVWVEAYQHHGQRKSGSHKIVTFETAARKGEPFEDMIKKYGIPNQKFKHCTRDLKRVPIEDWAKINFGKIYDTAIGIRGDELNRVSPYAATRHICYPLASVHPVSKPQINKWWDSQPFRLKLKHYQGNCKWCWKKSFRKHYTIINESPEVYDFPAKMEELYAYIGPEFSKQDMGYSDYKRTFFRGQKSTQDLFKEYDEIMKEGKFEPVYDEAKIYPFDPELDTAGACDESCEIYSINDEADGSS